MSKRGTSLSMSDAKPTASLLPGFDEQLSALEAFEAMRQFLEAFWERGGRSSEELANILSWTALAQPRGSGGTADPAQWNDWISAISAAKARNGTEGR